MVDSRREVHLLVPNPAHDRVLVAGNPPGLPRTTLTLAEGQPTIGVAIAALPAVVGGAVAIVEILFDYDQDPDAGPIPTLLVTDALHAAPASGLRWGSLDDLDLALPSTLRHRVDEFTAEWRTGADVPALRPRWSRPGWHARASRWLVSQLEAIDWTPTGPVEQIRHWGISAILRVPTTRGRAWFKAVYPPFHHEPAVTRLLATSFVDALPHVLAIEPDEGWLVTADLGDNVAAAADDATRAAAARTLIEMQRGVSNRTDELVGLGCPVRRLETLGADVAGIFDGAPAIPDLADDVSLPDLLGRIDRAVDRVEALGLPDTLVHGDFHGGNVAVLDGRIVIYDWSDAAVGNPLVDVITWPGYQVDLERRTPARLDYLNAWQAAMPGSALGEALPDVLTVGAAYQAVSYAGIVRGLEPIRNREFASPVSSYLRVAMSGVEAE